MTLCMWRKGNLSRKDSHRNSLPWISKRILNMIRHDDAAVVVVGVVVVVVSVVVIVVVIVIVHRGDKWVLIYAEWIQKIYCRVA